MPKEAKLLMIFTDCLPVVSKVTVNPKPVLQFSLSSWCIVLTESHRDLLKQFARVYPKVSGLAA
jgi:hypothetical protein